MAQAATISSPLAYLGGKKSLNQDVGDMFTWPIVTKEEEAAVLDVLRRGAMSGFDITTKFEEEYKASVNHET